jgi:hypothetical protein
MTEMGAVCCPSGFRCDVEEPDIVATLDLPPASVIAKTEGLDPTGVKRRLGASVNVPTAKQNSTAGAPQTAAPIVS